MEEGVEYERSQALQNLGYYDRGRRKKKMNKYNLDFGEQQKPDENVKLRLKTKEGEFDAVANVDELSNRETWDIKEVSK